MLGRRFLKKKEQGAALLIFAVILVLGTAWMLVAALLSSVNNTGATQTANGAVLQQARAALLGKIAIDAGDSTNANPGKLPCPEDPNPSTPGTAATFCTLPAIGRLPWRTLGIEKLTDASGEPLWYVLSPGFNRANSGVALKINSDTAAQLTLDGTANAAVALIIAPGSAINVQAATGCSARNQTRPPTQNGPFDYRDYLECDNATYPADSSFVSTGPSDSFNDQVLAVTHAEVFNIVEAAVAKRIELDVIPRLQSVYDTSEWSSSTATPYFPFAAPFANPDTASYTGTAGTYRGLLPVSYMFTPGSSTACVADASDPRCNPSLISWSPAPPVVSVLPASPITNSFIVTWSNGATISIDQMTQTSKATLASADCSGSTTTNVSCVVTYGRYCGNWLPLYPCSSSNVRPVIKLTVNAANVANSFRAFDTSVLSSTFYTFGSPSHLGVLKADGSADISTEWRAASSVSCKTYSCTSITITVPIALLTDHAVVNANDSVTGWFLSNEWYKLTYYALSTGNAPGSSGTCVPGGSPACVSIAATSGTTTANAILVLSGRNLGSGTRPSSALADYLEGANSTGTSLNFVSQPVSNTFNDRISTVYP